MHNEDNELGLAVHNPAGESWRAYGDKRLLDKVNSDNMNRLHNALMESVNEVFQAWKSHHIPNERTFGAWKHAPTIASAFDAVNHSPLFNAQGLVRSSKEDRFNQKYETFISWASCLGWLKIGPAFDHPMRI
jgi:hypothetical protein